MVKVCNRIIEYSFYALFLLVPLVFTSTTSELFELNKMWLTWALTIVIGTAWFTKMILQKRILFQRTPLDIPIGLFLLSQIISTIFSLDSHVSLWGYYSRFNGGLLSIISYIFLYYAFLSNLAGDTTGRDPTVRSSPAERSEKIERALAGGKVGAGPAIKMVKRLLFLSLLSGLIVALWGLPSHFGYDPTCFLFRGTFDVSCWTADFIPTIRIFSTLGQPAWLAAYLAILIPISIAFFINNLKSNLSYSQVKNNESGIMNHVLSKKNIHNSLFIILYSLFYVDLLFTRARSGILGIWISLAFFFAAYFWMERKKLKSLIIIGILLLITFVIGTPFNQIRILTMEGIRSVFQKPAVPVAEGGPARHASQPRRPTTGTVGQVAGDAGGTESGDIRINVWKGAINAWRENPIFGTGVETFAFAYYKYKPAEHNLTSEWNFLYNKAHNEYLNFLATTGIFGLGSYLLMIGWFIFKVINDLRFKIKDLRNEKNSLILNHPSLIIALMASYISILITNFFGFSVVITNIYLFMIPAFVFVLSGLINNPQIAKTNKAQKIDYGTSIWQWTSIFCIILASLFMILNLFQFWRADIAYALGYNLDRAGEYQQAYPNLHKAVELRGSELVFKDELSINDAMIAAGLLAQESPDDQKEQAVSVASTLIQEAINTSNEIVSKSPRNAVFWKTRVRLFYTLSQIDSRYLPKALEGIEKASLLAPNDANIWYNLGVLYGQHSNIKKGIEALEKTVKLKPDYRDAHYALGLYYRTDSQNTEAIAQMQYILDYIAPQDAAALESIKSWKE